MAASLRFVPSPTSNASQWTWRDLATNDVEKPVGTTHMLASAMSRNGYSFMPANAALRCQSNKADRRLGPNDALTDGLIKVLLRRRQRLRGREIDNRFRALSRRYRKNLASQMRREIKPPLWSPKRVATKPDAGNSQEHPYLAVSSTDRASFDHKLSPQVLCFTEILWRSMPGGRRGTLASQSHDRSREPRLMSVLQPVLFIGPSFASAIVDVGFGSLADVRSRAMSAVLQ